MGIKYVHTNNISKDWKELSSFYIKVFDCIPLSERDLSGEWIDKMTQIDKVEIKGIHLALPGYESGPTLEIFQYYPEDPNPIMSTINNPGYRHIAFHVDNVEEVLQKVIEHDGKQIGELIKKQYETLGLLTAVYVEDPEGNIIEIQNWKK